jgi:hypothetical protein
MGQAGGLAACEEGRVAARVPRSSLTVFNHHLLDEARLEHLGLARLKDRQEPPHKKQRPEWKKPSITA